MKVHHRSLLLINCQNKQSKNEVVVDLIAIHQESVNIELPTVAIKTFASMIDKDYDNTMIGCVGYSYAWEELLPISHCNFYYEES